eukprot:TRINITY_DN6414_c0_g1_i2.p1 TRINITY_DN6414_c0_g1~~TRINITY_DN6414_c0_g1_i2.p1  ORF type:complete len:179 (-),score=37.93 TRINITY_DN6414_c0_g1_i2:111-647(-)
MWNYYRAFNSAASNQKGEEVAQLLKKESLLPYYHGASSKPDAASSNAALEIFVKNKSNLGEINGNIMTPWDEVVVWHAKGIGAVQSSNFLDAYSHQVNLIAILTKMFSGSDSNWALPVLKTINLDLRIIAKHADAQLRASKRKEDKMEDAARILNSFFGICIRGEFGTSMSAHHILGL